MINSLKQSLAFLLLLLLSAAAATAQTDTTDNGITLSLVTGAPGTELYTVFGHSAIRVRNERTGQDVLFNYGTFDFDTPNFYWKFMRGKLLYMLSVEPTDRFLQWYEYDQRQVIEQVMNLTNAQEEQLLRFLQKNYQPENRFYLYDFFYDNCATVIRDVLEQQLDGGFSYQSRETREVTFRQLLDEYIQRYPWYDFGIDLILGLPADKKADFRNQMFLPDYLAKNLSEATLQSPEGVVLLLHAPRILVAAPPDASNSMTKFTPMLLFVIVATLTILLTLFANERWKNIFDVTILSILGVAGCFLLFMWVGTDHIATKWNWNVLWLNPLCLVLAIGIPRKATWLRTGFASYAAILWFLLLAWNWFPQQFNTAVIPILVALIARCADREGIVEIMKKLHKFVRRP